METVKAYSPLIDYDVIDDTAPPDIDDHLVISACLTELQRIVRDRPVVVLQNDFVKLNFLRPGAPREIELLFFFENYPVPSPKFDPQQHSFFDLANPPPCSKHPNDLAHLYKVCEKANLMRELYIEVVTHDIEYSAYSPSTKEDRAGSIALRELGLYECACPHACRFTNDRRQVFEQLFVQHILSVKPDRDDTVRVVSIGSGGLLQDWRLIGLLIKEGYSHFEWVVTDLDYPELPELARFKAFFQKLPDITIDIIDFSEFAEAHKALLCRQFQSDAVNAIDFNAGAWPLLDTHELLAPHGKVFFGSQHHDLVIGKSETVSLHQSFKSSSLCDHVDTILPADHEGDIHIAFNENPTELVDLLAHLKQSKKASFKVTFGNCHIADKNVRSYFQFFFPSMPFTLEIATCLQTYNDIYNGVKFDVTVHRRLDEVEYNEVYGSFQEQESHVLGKSCTVIELKDDEVSHFTYTPSEPVTVI